MSKLQQHFMKEHDLMLLDSEVYDILELARQEIELPSEIEVREEAEKRFGNSNVASPEWVFRNGADWALNKVRNPYPRPM